MVMKKDLTPLRKGGQITRQSGKGGKSVGMPDRRTMKEVTAPGANFNDYAKATPMAQPDPGVPPELMRLLMGGG